jgi:hypothetical protein
MVVGKELESITDQPRYDNEIGDNRNPGFYVHYFGWTH